MVKLKRTPDGKLGHTHDDVMVWADFYENISHKMSNQEDLSRQEVDWVIILLLTTAKTMREKPHEFLAKNKVGRPSEDMKAFLEKQLYIYACIGAAKNVTEARRKIAVNFLNHALPSNKIEETYEEFLDKKIKTIEKQTKKFPFDKYAKRIKK